MQRLIFISLQILFSVITTEIFLLTKMK